MLLASSPRFSPCRPSDLNAVHVVLALHRKGQYCLDSFIRNIWATCCVLNFLGGSLCCPEATAQFVLPHLTATCLWKSDCTPSGRPCPALSATISTRRAVPEPPPWARHHGNIHQPLGILPIPTAGRAFIKSQIRGEKCRTTHSVSADKRSVTLTHTNHEKGGGYNYYCAKFGRLSGPILL